ncbi:Low-affinity putrescine importer PlaP (plasmid) [Tsukamurella tyrosinosolvens]|uniref:Amino acid/polyamine/organocation transporter, APC superfamily n=1 Tax=Tsukamurella tyrosinosolvens TaxID=57704 RepID=A0A1H4PX91_TSUTY|nr:amino acid permease [Tsukamurella tyrosinosolvens]KXO97475.1 amino acid permease [Tsukamurella tyrosinosolvens]SEC12009.1 amino acid/polyamine/organocation transporter, APC superfamily [Tsukamurella tyrosinosolvens]VEH96814.1 Low-affinity putrescine importer PlaP [Tsukamurella tyrosinosolvens]
MANPLLRTKSVEQSIADTEVVGTRLKKQLTAWDLTIFGVAVVVGAGIFTIGASTAGDYSGPAVSVSFIIAAIACGLAALCYAEFASTVPVAGSAYTFSYATFGEFVAWIIGWDLVLEFSIAAAAVASGWSSYLGTVFGTGPAAVEVGGHTIDWGAMLIVGVLTVLLTFGAKVSSRVSAVITAIKVAVVLLVIVVGAFYIKGSNYSPFVPESVPGEKSGVTLDSTLFQAIFGSGSSYGWFGVLAGAGIVFFAFIGFDIVATSAEETVKPQRDVPRGILGSLAIVTVLYIAVTVVVTGMASYKDLATSAGEGGEKNLAYAFSLNGVDWAATIISIGALAGLTTVVMVLLMGQNRVLFAMARDGLLPRQLAKTSDRGVPVRISVGVGVVVAFLAGIFPLKELTMLINIGTLFAFVLVSVGVIVLRKQRPDLKRGFTAPLVPLVPILSVLACGWLMFNLTLETWVRFLIWMALGVIVYFVYSKNHSILGKRERGEVIESLAD